MARASFEQAMVVIKLALQDFAEGMFTLSIVILCALCALGTGVLAINGDAICQKLGLMDAPGERKHHKKSTPLVGGLALTCVILPVIIAAIFICVEAEARQSTLVFALATFSMSLIGMADDRHSLAARDRILLAFLVFVSVAIISPSFNVRVLKFAFFDFEIGLFNSPIAIAFTTLCCVGLINAVNMADGKNGLVIGLCICWLLILSTKVPISFLPILLIIASGLTVLFIFNIFGRVFLGDGGSYGFATAIGLIAIMTYNSHDSTGTRSVSAEQVMALFAVPVLDSFRLTFSRIARGQSPMAPDRDHLHHHLQNWLGWPAGLCAYLAMAITPAALLY
jgi:UDP-GlcNAc:undecaprenyl-phosphate/decaprenyl-phosphate GlcNAc-1-phosphate transferase